MLKLKVGDILSIKTLKSELGISQDTWQRNKTRILEEMKDYYDYELKENAGRETQIIIKQVIDEDIQYSYQRKNTAEAEKAKRYLWRYLISKVGANKLITGSSAGRDLWNKNIPELKDYSKKWIARQISQLSKYNYYLDELRGQGVFGKVKEVIWVTLDYEHNEYVRMTDEQVDFFFSVLRGKFNVDWNNKMINLLFSEDSPLTAEEKDSYSHELLKMSWERAQTWYQKEFGGKPFNIKVFENGQINLEGADIPLWLRKEIKNYILEVSNANL